MGGLAGPLVFPLGGDFPAPLPDGPPRFQRIPAGTTNREVGSDISTFPDLDPSFQPMTDRRLVLAQALMRRFTTSPGQLRGSPTYGRDIRQYLNAAFDISQLTRMRHDIEMEARKDERIKKASAVLSYNSSAQAISINIEVTDFAGPFRLTLAVTALTVELLTVT